MNFIESYKPQHSALWKASLLFMLVAGLLIATDQLSIRYGLEGWLRIVDDLLGGLIAGSIFYLYERHRLRRLRQRLHVIDLMNHHIRNALQPLMFMTYEHRTQMRTVEGCVRRIDWALREVLPGKSEERFLMHDDQFVREDAPSVTLRPPSSSKIPVRGPEHTNRPSQPLFSQWLDNWRSRNERAS